MRVTDSFKNNKNELDIAKNLGITQNVSIRVIDKDTGKVVSEHSGHNSATNSLITGIGHYLIGEGIFNQGYEMLHKYVPLYISLGTMGLLSQEEDEEGLPKDVGVMPDPDDKDDEDSQKAIADYFKYLEKYDLILNGHQEVTEYGDAVEDPDPEHEGYTIPRLQTDVDITVDDEYVEEYTYRAYTYPPNNDKEYIEALLEDTQTYQPQVEYCTYYVNLIDTGEVDEYGNKIIVPETKLVEDPDNPGHEREVPVWTIAKGLKGIEEAISVLRQCPYCTSGTCEMGPKCLECVFPEKKILIDALEDIRSKWTAELEAVEIKLADAYDDLEEIRYNKYLDECPGYGADGSCTPRSEDNNFRKYFGLGPAYADRPDQTKTIDCELMSDRFHRQQISFRQIVPEYQSEFKNTIDVVFSAMITTGALKEFREPGKNYVFITEAGLWSDPEWSSTDTNGENGLLAGYRIAPADSEKWDMSKPENRKALRSSILKVGLNQVVQVVWKLQIGGVDQFEGMRDIFTQKKYQDSDGLLFGHVPTHYPYPPMDSSRVGEAFAGYAYVRDEDISE